MRYWNDFLNVVTERQAEITMSLANGNVSNFESYMKLVGQIAGLEMSKDIVHNLLQDEENE